MSSAFLMHAMKEALDFRRSLEPFRFLRGIWRFCPELSETSIFLHRLIFGGSFPRCCLHLDHFVNENEIVSQSSHSPFLLRYSQGFPARPLLIGQDVQWPVEGGLVSRTITK